MHICRTCFNKEIITEFVPPVRRNSNKIVIFCSGVPSAPCKDDVLEFWARKGFWAFFPRYRGTWESGGKFLAYSLEQDVFDVIIGMQKKFVDFWGAGTYQVKPESITVVGSSFGGPAALLASRDPRVTKVVCISPVVDWKAEDKSEPLKNLRVLLRQGFGGAYRIHDGNYNKLARGSFYNPVNHIDEMDGRKILIYHAKDDDVVDVRPVRRFAKKVGCDFILLNKGGHLSSTMLMDKKHFHQVKAFLNK